MSWLSNLGDSISDAAGAVADAATEVGNDIADAAEDFAGDVQDTWDDAVGDVQNGIEEGGFLGGVLGIISAGLAGSTGLVGNVIDLTVDVGGAFAGGTVSVGGAVIGGVAEVLVTVVTGDSAKGKKVGDGFRAVSSGVGGLLSDIANLLGDSIERGFDVGAQLIRYTIAKGRCTLQSGYDWVASLGDDTKPTGMSRVKHFFVLVLENRSFDHMLGQSTMKSIEKFDNGSPANSWVPAPVPPGGNAKLQLKGDPPHEFPDVQAQLALDTPNPMTGFVRTFWASMTKTYGLHVPEEPEEVMRGFTKGRLPILHTLAEEFCVFDQWYAALPGPTVPNRLFFHAATSGGLADSPSSPAMGWSQTMGGFDFEHGTVFDHLTTSCVDWAIYAGDATPQVMLLEGIAVQAAASGLRQRRLRGMDDFAEDLQEADDDFPAYVFLEPDYGHWWSDFHEGQSQHPRGSVSGGESLIKMVYESIRNSPIWESSALVITYDEHGGFYDHVVPPAGRPPGDTPKYRTWGSDPASQDFAFDRLGVRVPAVLVSPFTERGAFDHTPREHSTVVKALHELFGISTLTVRGDHAPSISHLFRRAHPRQDAPTQLPDVFGSEADD